MSNVIRNVGERVIQHHYRLVARAFHNAGREWGDFPHDLFRGQDLTFWNFVWRALRVDDEEDMFRHIIALQDAAIDDDFTYLAALSNRSYRRVLSNSCACLLVYYLHVDRLFELLHRSMRGQYMAERTLERWLFGP